ncbi:uncharacterized protein LOC111024756 [Momordica charantia]|uniref:Uncharacterized protein LOC111024756 n=1 Tax=Momordica charantia TaxID=3673 RepID=A0A6J1DV83_MOMCH|nr:uncharacterized protein LOC111024756 [Momordica charantia]
MGDGEEKRKMKDGGSKFCRKKLEENSNETDGVPHCFSCLPIIFNNCNSLLQALIRFLGFQLHTQHPHHSSSSPTANGAYHLISSSPELCYPGGSDLPPTMADPPPDGSGFMQGRESEFSRRAPPPRRSTGGGGQTN